MSTALPAIETARLSIRPFQVEDGEDIHRMLCAAWDIPEDRREQSLASRLEWLSWTVASYRELASLDQPPYGDRAIVLRETGRLIGSVGLVPSIGPFRQIPGFPDHDGSTAWYPEVGLFWAVDPQFQRHGYATEAGRALLERAMDQFHLARVVATTEHDNIASVGVMRKLGMTVLTNPFPDPAWLQVVGVFERHLP